MSEGALAQKRLILGFDAGCMMCSDLAKRVEKQVGDKLEVKSLSDPQVKHWREQELGEGAPWAPTLVEVGGGKAKVWTGPAMGLALSRRLGLVATWRIMQILGDINTAHKQDEHSKSSILSRGQFLKGMAGTAAAATFMVSGGTAALAQKGTTNGEMSALEAAKRTYGITPDDLMVKSNSARAGSAIRQSGTNAQVESLMNQLESAGFRLANPEAQLIEIPLARSGEANLEADLVTYSLNKNGRSVGSLYYISGTKDDLVFAVNERNDGNIVVRYFNDESLEHTIYNRNGNVVSSTDPRPEPTVSSRAPGCRAICGAVCAGGAPGTVGGCVARCLLNPICTPLCTTLVALGCLFGCDDICRICCN